MELFKLLGVIAIDNKGANDSIDETTNNAKKGESQIVNTFKKIGAAVITYFAVDKIINFGKQIVSSAASVKAAKAQYEAAFKDLQGSATEMFQGIGDETGILASRLKGIGTQAFSQFKGAGLDAAEALKKTNTFTRLAADGAAYYDMSLEETSELLRSFTRGNTEAGDRIGLFTSETQRNQAALDKLGKKYIECSEAEKQMIMLDIANKIYESSGAMGQATREADGYENVVGNLKESWKQFQAVIGQPLLEKVVPIIQNLTDKIQNLGPLVQNIKDKFSDLNGFYKEHKDIIDTIIIILGSFAVAFGIVQGAILAYNIVIGIATGITTAFSAAIAFITSPIGIAIAIIGALIAIGVLLYKNWDSIKESAINIFNFIKDWISNRMNDIKIGFINFISATKNIFESIKAAIWSPIQWILDKIVGIKDKLSEPFKSAANAISNVWSGIKSVFKLPHFKFSGSLNPADWINGGLPKIGVDWYAKGGILKQPTAFGINPQNGNLRVGGEAGDEAVAPISTLKQYVREAVAEAQSNKETNGQRIFKLILNIENIYNERKQDIEALAEELYYYLKRLETAEGR